MTTTAYSVFSDSSTIASDYNRPMKSRGSKPSRKERNEKGKTTWGVGDKSGEKVEELKTNRVKSDPPDGIEEAMLKTHKKRIGKDVQSRKSPSHLVRPRVSVLDTVLRRPSRQKWRAGDEDDEGYHRMEEANTKSAVVSTSSSATDDTEVYQHMEDAYTKFDGVFASSAAKEIKANHFVEEASASYHLADDTNTTADSASSAAHDTKAYQRMSKDNVQAVFTQNEQAVVTGKNEKFQRMSADLAAVGEDIAAMGGDMMSSFADAFSELTTSQDTEHIDATLVGNSERKVASRSPSPKKGKRVIRDDDSSVQAVALGRHSFDGSLHSS
jgi:hypothetical protein